MANIDKVLGVYEANKPQLCAFIRVGLRVIKLLAGRGSSYKGADFIAANKHLKECEDLRAYFEEKVQESIQGIYVRSAHGTPAQHNELKAVVHPEHYGSWMGVVPPLVNVLAEIFEGLTDTEDQASV